VGPPELARCASYIFPSRVVVIAQPPDGDALVHTLLQFSLYVPFAKKVSASKDALFAARAAVEAEEVAQAAKAPADSEERRPREAHSQ